MAALLNVSMCSKVPSTPQLPLPTVDPNFPIRSYLALPVLKNHLEALASSISRAGLWALLSASLRVTDPALAFKSILRQENFKGAKFVGASFFDGDLTDVDLRVADFSLANVTKANLSNATLEGALVTGNTSFRGSNIIGADFTDVALRYLCKVADGKCNA